MKIYIATFSASLISAIGLIACLITLCSICNHVGILWSEFDHEIKAFKVNTDDMWRDMIHLASVKKRSRRQHSHFTVSARYPASIVSSRGIKDAAPPGSLPPESAEVVKEQGKCSCRAKNKCPAGLPGPPGLRGPKGPDGIPGQKGKPGKNAINVRAQKQDDSCFYCPPGSQGPPGAMGRPGIRGLAGAHGSAGVSGRNGNPGLPGEQGPIGEPGKDGAPGRSGDKGIDFDHIVGWPGAKGVRGKQGKQGQPGDQGDTGVPGRCGLPGKAGLRGMPGRKGVRGALGDQGSTGRPGQDAQYCPCPARQFGESAKFHSSLQETTNRSAKTLSVI